MEKQDENCTQLTKNFFKHKMKIVGDVPIRFVCRTGNGKNKPILVSLMNPADKAHIYTHVKHLQGQKDELKKPYRVEDHLPNRLKAEQKKLRNIKWRNGRKENGTVAQKLEMQFKKGKLFIENKEYQSKIQMPSVRQLLKLKADEVEMLKSTEVTAGSEVKQGGSTFQGYVADVSTLDVNRAYEWVKFNNMDARHVMCACRIPGPNFPYLQDYQDDDEHGGGNASSITCWKPNWKTVPFS